MWVSREAASQRGPGCLPQSFTQGGSFLLVLLFPNPSVGNNNGRAAEGTTYGGQYLVRAQHVNKDLVSSGLVGRRHSGGETHRASGPSGVIAMWWHSVALCGASAGASAWARGL